ncbi:hypothetical protein Aph02nite_28350 [Actinoplanes philippinensis]|nr:hypothetical protein Aph02nite_28350 [Actinoplanes philippinensis]
MWFTVLGPVRAWRGDQEIDLGSPQARSLLAVLLAHGGQSVSLARLVDTMWGPDSPRTAVNAIHRNIGLLRRRIEPDLPARRAGGWLVRSAGGYRVDADGDSLDLLRFRGLVMRARAGGGRGAIELYHEALGLWSGAGGEGIDPRVRADAVFTRLEQELSTVARDAADVALAVGGAGVLADAVEQVAGRAPFDEPLHERLIRLLGAAGQQARALQSYQDLRRRLGAELGLSPAASVDAARDAVLRSPRRARQLRSATLLSYRRMGCPLNQRPGGVSPH